MAFSTTADHSQTGTTVITEALELLGVLAEGEAPSADQSTSALRTLNNFIKMIGADTAIYSQGEYTLDLVADTATYTLDTSNVGYIPTKVLAVNLYNSTSYEERQLSPLTQEEWYTLGNKTTSAPPTHYFYKRNAQGTGVTFNLWPVPNDTTYDLKLWLQYPLRDVDSAADDVYFTPEWYLSVTYGLAYLLAPKYGIVGQEREQLHRDYMMFREEAESYDTDGSLYFQPDMRP